MEKHFLSDLVQGESRVSHPEPWYNSVGDCIVYQMCDEAIVANRIDGVLTIYNSAITGKSIGYQIKGVEALTKMFGWEGISVETKQDGEELVEVSITALLLAAYEQGPKTIGRRRAYADAFESSASSPRIRSEDLLALIP